MSQHARTYQMQFTPDVLAGLPPGARITGLAFRLQTNTAADFPTTTISWSNYQVTMAQAANPITSMSTNFQANLLNPVLVKSGPLSILPGTFTAGGNPNPFATMLVFDTPYVYQGGDLVMQFTHSGSDSALTAFLDAASTAAPGYGTSFRAISTNGFAGTIGAAAAVTIVELQVTLTITQAITLTANQAIVSGGGGLGGAAYQVLTTTNLAVPANQWTPIATNQFGANGFFSYTNVIQPNIPAQYFRVLMP